MAKKKIEAAEFHVSKICEEAELDALMITLSKKLNYPDALIDFDLDLADLIVKRLMKVPFSEVKRLYGDRLLIEYIQEIIGLEKQHPNKEENEKRLSFYV